MADFKSCLNLLLRVSLFPNDFSWTDWQSNHTLEIRLWDCLALREAPFDGSNEDRHQNTQLQECKMFTNTSMSPTPEWQVWGRNTFGNSTKPVIDFFVSTVRRLIVRVPSVWVVFHGIWEKFILHLSVTRRNQNVVTFWNNKRGVWVMHIFHDFSEDRM